LLSLVVVVVVVLGNKKEQRNPITIIIIVMKFTNQTMKVFLAAATAVVFLGTASGDSSVPMDYYYSGDEMTTVTLYWDGNRMVHRDLTLYWDGTRMVHRGFVPMPPLPTPPVVFLEATEDADGNNDTIKMKHNQKPPSTTKGEPDHDNGFFFSCCETAVITFLTALMAGCLLSSPKPVRARKYQVITTTITTTKAPDFSTATTTTIPPTTIEPRRHDAEVAMAKPKYRRPSILLPEKPIRAVVMEKKASAVRNISTGRRFAEWRMALEAKQAKEQEELLAMNPINASDELLVEATTTTTTTTAATTNSIAAAAIPVEQQEVAEDVDHSIDESLVGEATTTTTANFTTTSTAAAAAVPAEQEVTFDLDYYGEETLVEEESIMTTTTTAAAAFPSEREEEAQDYDHYSEESLVVETSTTTTTTASSNAAAEIPAEQEEIKDDISSAEELATITSTSTTATATASGAAAIPVEQEATKDVWSLTVVINPDDCDESLAPEPATTTTAISTAVATTIPAATTSPAVGSIVVDNADDDDGSSTTSIIATTTPEEIFMARYELVKELGQGAFGTVFRARSLAPGSSSSATFAVKMIMPPDDRSRQMIQREIKTLCYLWGNSDDIVQLLEVFELSSNSWALVMEECRGGSVADRLGIKGYYFEDEALALFANLLRGLQYVHDLGIVHLDLKPANVLLVEQGDDTRIKLADFGLAQRVHTPNGLIRGGGTPGYMAPELSSFGALTKLVRLGLWDNSLTGTIPSALGSLTSLEALVLNKNALTGTIPSALGALTALTALFLRNNTLTGSFPSSMISLTSLNELTLYDNQITGTIPFCGSTDYDPKFVSLEADCKEVACPCCTQCW
jgi:Protein kinase domain/Leucine rich repeat